MTAVSGCNLLATQAWLRLFPRCHRASDAVYCSHISDAVFGGWTQAAAILNVAGKVLNHAYELVAFPKVYWLGLFPQTEIELRWRSGQRLTCDEQGRITANDFYTVAKRRSESTVNLDQHILWKL